MTTLIETFVCKQAIKTNIYRMYYRICFSGTKFHSVKALDVNASVATESPQKLAELIGLKYILLHSDEIGQNRTGKDLRLSVSSGAIKKIQKQHTSNSDLKCFGLFLQSRFNLAQISVGRNFSWADAFDGKAVPINIRNCQDEGVETKVGEIQITRHAIERFMERIKDIHSLDKAWRKLSKVLVGETEWTMLKKKTQAKCISETWMLKRNGMKLFNVVIIRNSFVNRLVTVIN
jgi:hypothetical protein